MSKAAEHLLRHLNDNVWVSESHAVESGYADAIKELLDLGLVEHIVDRGVNIILIASKNGISTYGS